MAFYYAFLKDIPDMCAKVKSLILLAFLFTTVSSAQVRINEFMAFNSSTLKDQDGEYPDWIELYNSSSQNVNLSGWSLTDDPE